MIGYDLNLDNSFLNKHPFPGPGLPTIFPGNIKAKKFDLLRKADHFFWSTHKNVT